MTNPFWKLVAMIIAQPAIVRRLIARAQRTPYTHISSPDGDVYMERYWLFNPYDTSQPRLRKFGWCPISIRLHRIMRRDGDRHLHDHPWNSRSIILDVWYLERRLLPNGETRIQVRSEGNTARLRFGEYHRIVQVPAGGVWTIFITGRYRGTWGFLVDGKKVPWREYLGIGSGTAP